ncbi:Lrp/AsnC family transcriptional regulator [Natronoglycomyces albus]|uniref:Lrp/AsnC family transcriptional regulator n=1 Tax=Natronoglycomyces albus TaxID=2811108 RepID=A0A895XQK1_9ACTN|nr:Lrp/AsnC family transcriptional regulator [Natronoglycomyces albus]QSB05425.1 Lrp/AsnC family transcriptional regulator [Natronoglycomyces albus]
MNQSVALDSIDLQILALLQADGRMTNRDLAVRVGLAASTCQARVRRLRDAGAIKGFAVELDLAALGSPVQAFLAVQVRPHRRPVVAEFVAHLQKIPQVRRFYHLTGPDDFLIHVAVDSVDGLQALVLDAVTARSEVLHVRTNLIFAEWKGPSLLPQATTTTA